MIRRSIGMSGLLGFVCAVLLVSAAAAQRSDKGSREQRLPCNGVVRLFYGDELIWRKGAGEIQSIQGLVEVPGEKKGMTGMQLASLLALRPNVAAIELESCKPRLRRFDRAELESEKGAGLYLVATNYRGFRLRNISRNRGGGGGMKNIGKIVLVPATDDVLPGNQESVKKSGKNSAKESHSKTPST